MMIDIRRLKSEFDKITKVLEAAEPIDKHFAIETSEFVGRRKKVYAALEAAGLKVGFVFSDEHYNGDVPYLGGNTNRATLLVQP